MNIQVAVLCDAATDDNGKLNLLGAFDTIYTQQLPAIHPQCSIALRVTFSSGDEGKHALALNFVDADGHSIAKFPPIPVEVALPDDMHFGTRNFIVNIQQPIAGEHSPAGAAQSAGTSLKPERGAGVVECWGSWTPIRAVSCSPRRPCIAVSSRDAGSSPHQARCERDAPVVRAG